MLPVQSWFNLLSSHFQSVRDTILICVQFTRSADMIVSMFVSKFVSKLVSTVVSTVVRVKPLKMSGRRVVRV